MLMRKIIRYVFITLMLACGLVLALPFAGFRKNLDTELSKPISRLIKNGNSNNKKNIQLFNVLGFALNNPSIQIVLIAENESTPNANKNTEKLVYIPYVVKSNDLQGNSISSNPSGVLTQNSQANKSGYLPLIASVKSGNSDKVTSQAISNSLGTTTESKRQAIDTPDPGGSGGGTPLGSLPIGDAYYFITILIAMTTLYKFKKATFA